MKIRFQADADLKQSIVRGVRRREPAIDFRDSRDAKLEALDDPQVLALAAADGRVLVSHDVATMPSHFRDFLNSHSSPGILLAPQFIPWVRSSRAWS